HPVVVVFCQAEDGIRDRNVTGVQTCALPILCGEWYADVELIGDVCEECLKAATTPENIWKYSKQEGEMKRIVLSVPDVVADFFRSEERRVGKECRGRGARKNVKRSTTVQPGR